MEKDREKLAEKILSGIKKHFPEPRIELNYRNEFELLIAVLLSAQTTDKKVNEVTPILFNKYPTPQKLARAAISDLCKIIKPLGFFKRKSELIKKCAQAIVEKFDGRIPSTIEELTQLPGVGRKTASAVLVNAFNKPAIVVDTHVIRVATERLKLSKAKDADKIEQDLASIFPEKDWQFLSNGMVLFGRYICTAKNPNCASCHLYDLCPYEKKGVR
jgi:endonuclease-3|uniref:Endonuclease III n=1 Tax=candidate division WOR-3 bacterium TaxID=2052148 RepID=A0A7V3RG25_UNCW3